MPASGDRSGVRAVLHSVLPLVAVVGTGWLALSPPGGASWAAAPRGGALATEATLHAAPLATKDADGDGLTADAEFAMGTSDALVDSDGDGFGDLEELARGSRADDAGSRPLPGSVDLGLSASGEEDGPHLQIACYFTEGDPSRMSFGVGVVVDGEPRFVPQVLEQPNVTWKRRPALNGAGQVLLIDVPFPESVVHNLGALSIFAVMSETDAPTFDAAGAVDLVSQGGVVMLVQEVGSQMTYIGQSQSQGTGAHSGSVYRPIPSGGGGVPSTWTPGEICYQVMVEVGNDNGVVSKEVVAADCITGWDTHCSGDCGASVGDVVQTFDPLGLVGG